MVGIVISGHSLELASRRNNFSLPSDGLVFFGIRGAVPDREAEDEFTAKCSVSFADVNYMSMRCTIGQWSLKDNTIALYQGSTVPSRVSMISARAKGGVGANRLIPGKYLYKKGEHKPDSERGHRAFRQAVFFPVQRTANDLTFDNQDPIDFGAGPGSFVWDNLHASYSDTTERYASAGCQVVRGQPMSRSRGSEPETGAWRKFVETAYERFAKQQLFTYLLFTAEELGALLNSDPSQARQAVKYGSSGPLAAKVQDGLQARGFSPGKLDGEFGRSSLMALVGFQLAKFGRGGGDGVCGPHTFAALGIEEPLLRGARVLAASTSKPEAPDEKTADMPDETDLPAEEQERWWKVVNNWLSAARVKAGDGSATKAAEFPDTGGVQEVSSPGSIDRDSDIAQQASLSNFERAQEIIRDFEGAFVHHPADPGGATNFGITRATLAAWRKVDEVSVADVKKLSYHEAKEIYKSAYWDLNGCGEMPGPVALAVYNTGVHCGTKTAATYLQRSLNKKGAGLDVDGKIGKNTLAALRLAPVAEVCDSLIGLYEERLRGHPKFPVFKEGFENRVRKLRDEVAKWLAETVLPDEAPAAPAVARKISTELNGVPDMARNVDDVLKKFIAELGAALEAAAAKDGKPPTPGGGSPPLGPVNGALGSAIGNALNGKKSAIGIIGALLTSLLSNPAPGSVTGDIGAVLVKWLPLFAGSGGALLPIFLAIFAWGVLGKMEKWTERKA